MPTIDALTVPGDLQDQLWQLGLYIIILAVVVAIVISTCKHVVKLISPEFLNNKWTRVVLRLMPIFLGLAFALVPGVFEGYTVGVQLLFGLIAGAASESVYNKVKALLPKLVLSYESRLGLTSSGDSDA